MYAQWVGMYYHTFLVVAMINAGKFFRLRVDGLSKFFTTGWVEACQ